LTIIPFWSGLVVNGTGKPEIGLGMEAAMSGG
jgi:hypothetical protein